MDNISSQISQKFRLVSTFSMIAVVFIHAKFIMSRWNVFMDTSTVWGRISDFVQFAISEMLCRLAVPMFFLISGFFMAYHNDGSIKSYIAKVKKRVKSLLIPYLIFSMGWLAISMFFTRIEICSIKDFILRTFVSPLPFQFWFLQHLMILILTSVLSYRLIKNLGICVMAILGVIYLLDNNGYMGFCGSLFYYCMGIFLCINPLNSCLKHCKDIFVIIFTVLFIACAIVHFLGIDIAAIMVLSKVMIFSGVCWLVWWIILDQTPLSTPHFLAINPGTSFLIFCLHEPMLSFFKNMYLHIFDAQYEILLGYFILPCIVILLCFIIDYLIKNTSLKLYKVLSGGR